MLWSEKHFFNFNFCTYSLRLSALIFIQWVGNKGATRGGAKEAEAPLLAKSK